MYISFKKEKLHLHQNGMDVEVKILLGDFGMGTTWEDTTILNWMLVFDHFKKKIPCSHCWPLHLLRFLIDSSFFAGF